MPSRAANNETPTLAGTEWAAAMEAATEEAVMAAAATAEVMAAVMVEATVVAMAAAAMVVVAMVEATAEVATEAAETAVGATEAGVMEVAMEVVVTEAETEVRRSPRRRSSGQHGLPATDRMSKHQNRRREQRRGARPHMSARTAPTPTPAPHRDRSHYGD